MLSMKGCFRKVDPFSQLFEASAKEVRNSVFALINLLKSSPDEGNLETSFRNQKNYEQFNEDIAILLCKSNTTRFEWRDIEALSLALYRISKTIRKLSNRVLLSKPYLSADFSDAHIKILENTSSVVYEMVRQLWGQPNLSEIKDENNCLHSMEVEAGEHFFEMRQDLQSGKYEVMQAIILYDLLDLFEKAVDRCRDAGNIIYYIVLKCS